MLPLRELRLRTWARVHHHALPVISEVLSAALATVTQSTLVTVSHPTLPTRTAVAVAAAAVWTHISKCGRRRTQSVRTTRATSHE